MSGQQHAVVRVLKPVPASRHRRIPRQAHKIAAKHALVLSRSDVLTRILNRRGFLEEFTYVLRTAIEDTINEETFHFPHGLVDMVDFLTPA